MNHAVINRSAAVILGLLWLVLAAGCASKSNEDKLVGTWKLDTERMLEASDMSEQERAFAQAMMSAMEMTMTFRDNGTVDVRVAAMGQERSDSGEWHALSEQGNTITVAANNGKGGTDDEMTIEFVDDDTISLVPPDMGDQPVIMIRQ